MALKLTSNSTARMSSIVSMDWGSVTSKPIAVSSLGVLTVTWASGSSNLFITSGKTATINNTLTFAGTDATTMTFPTTSATIARTDAANTFTGHQTIEGVTTTGATGTGKLVFDTAPTLGAVTLTSVNKVTITAPATTATLTLTNNTVVTGPAATGTLMTLGNAESVTGAKTFSDLTVLFAGSSSGTTTVKATATASGTLTLPAATDTLVGKATSDIFTNKTFNSTATGNVLQVSGVTVSAGQYPGETTTGSATAGNVGEYIESVIASGSAIATVTATAKTVTSISLTAGDWDVSGNISFITVAGTSVTGVSASISGSTNTNDLTAGKFAGLFFGATVPGAATPAFAMPVGPYRLSLSGTTTVFLVQTSFYTAAALTAYGIIRARRVR